MKTKEIMTAPLQLSSGEESLRDVGDLSSEEQKKTIEKIKRARKKLRYLSEGAQKSRKLGFEPLTLVQNMWPEALTSEHRFPPVMARIMKDWEGSQAGLPLEEWLKKNPPEFLSESARESVVKYLTPKERKDYEVQIEDGKLCRNGKPFSTEKEKTEFSRQGTAIFVLSPDEKLYMSSHVRGKFHHSSFLSGKAVIGAGEIKSDSNGKIIRINSKSGHYRPSLDQNLNVLEFLKERKVDLSDVVYHEISSPDSIVLIYSNAETYLNAKGRLLPSEMICGFIFINVSVSSSGEIILTESKNEDSEEMKQERMQKYRECLEAKLTTIK